jgi:uncharacterized protein YyaL (SSP411 family)
MSGAHDNRSAIPRPANRLAREASPYLRQHQHNPVDWFAWGDEAFAKARQEDKPIFLSIGYSTCHWCHVMERESFEDPAVADLLNRFFVSIKVDREERPDVDKIYMTAVQAMVGQGGWPLNSFLTPALKPFYGGTYFPPAGRQGRPGFSDLLRQIAMVWKERRSEVDGSAEQLHAQMTGWLTHRPASGFPLGEHLLGAAAATLKTEYDAEHGGFGGAPKFPQPSVPQFLLQYGQAYGDAEAVAMVLNTCRKMAAGGLHDQLGGGFARYSVDAQWLVPHFEKMLYDNAQLLELYLDAWLVSGDASFAETARGIVRYLLRDMTHPEGGFYSAEDADSEGKEGKFYCWTLAECRELLTAEELAAATKYFGLTEAGNFVDHSDPDPLPDQNVLSVVNPQLTAAEQTMLTAAKAKLFAARSRRVRPHLDDKILASWNGLMLAALARAGVVLGDDQALAAARKNAAFIHTHLWDPTTGVLYHRWRAGERDTVQLLDAYAFQIHGQLALHEATLDPEPLAFAEQLARTMLDQFLDREQGGFWQSDATPDLIVRVKEDYDGAEPSGNSVAALSLLKLAVITGNEAYRTAAGNVLRLFGQRLARLPQATAFMLRALAFFLGETQRVSIGGRATAVETRNLLSAAHSVYRPLKVITGGETAGPAQAQVCTGSACQTATSDPAQLIASL